jgi:hypothetical protein
VTRLGPLPSSLAFLSFLDEQAIANRSDEHLSLNTRHRIWETLGHNPLCYDPAYCSNWVGAFEFDDWRWRRK